ncbi:MAG: hypothetical protein ABS61_05760 [Microbacterium sp. SCN 70-18]|nr:hypothetical protein A8L33_03355 [Microbacterium chocolatum]ANG85822.1 hypothetical protein A8L33_10895 [Microbacterium chocolatum]ODT10943.1 MAG: hypothetical protein ABS61_05760 [Microbacterium sp. SCN 70-18]
MRGDEHPDARFGEESRAERSDDRFHRLLEVSALDGEVVDAGRGASHGELRRSEFGVRRSVESEPLASADKLAQRKPPELFTELDGAGHDERFEHVDGRDASDLGTVPRGDQRAEPFSSTA